MMKCRGVVLFVIAVAFVGMATAQNPYSFKSRPSPSPATKPLTPKSASVTQPLTPKSASPKRSTASLALPNAAANSRKTNAELMGLEQQNLRAGGSKSGNREAVKSASTKPIGTPSRSASGINASYQKPHVSQNK
ncbi:MAG: hypothetical protein WB762_30645 [Candidatus Sulfotelmatobacter sp.]